MGPLYSFFNFKSSIKTGLEKRGLSKGVILCITAKEGFCFCFQSRSCGFLQALCKRKIPTERLKHAWPQIVPYTIKLQMSHDHRPSHDLPNRTKMLCTEIGGNEP